MLSANAACCCAGTLCAGHGGIVCNSQAPHNLVRYTITGKHTKVQEIKITS